MKRVSGLGSLAVGAAALTLLAGCGREDKPVVFTTHSTIGFDVDATSGSTVFGWDRSEGFVTFDRRNRNRHSVLASIAGDFGIFTSAIDSTFATGFAATRLSASGTDCPTLVAPASTILIPENRGSERAPTFFGTSMSVGLRFSGGAPSPTGVSLGIKRSEFAWIPMSNFDTGVPSMIAIMSTGYGAHPPKAETGDPNPAPLQTGPTPDDKPVENGRPAETPAPAPETTGIPAKAVETATTQTTPRPRTVQFFAVSEAAEHLACDARTRRFFTQSLESLGGKRPDEPSAKEDPAAGGTRALAKLKEIEACITTIDLRMEKARLPATATVLAEDALMRRLASGALPAFAADRPESALGTYAGFTVPGLLATYDEIRTAAETLKKSGADQDALEAAAAGLAKIEGHRSYVCGISQKLEEADRATENAATASMCVHRRELGRSALTMLGDYLGSFRKEGKVLGADAFVSQCGGTSPIRACRRAVGEAILELAGGHESRRVNEERTRLFRELACGIDAGTDN